jgi:hypothetical protein
MAGSRLFLALFFPSLIVYFVSLLLGNDLLVMLGSWFYVFMLYLGLVLSSYYRSKHLSQVFQPAVELVLQELQPQLQQAGYTVDLVIENGSWCPPRWAKAFLRFTPIRDEEGATTK